MELTKENFLVYAGQYIEQILLRSDQRVRAEEFTNVMEKAREFGLDAYTLDLAQKTAAEFGEPELWELPEAFEKPVKIAPFPVSCLPETLSKYLQAVCNFVQVDADMAALPMLSVLSLCLQGKALVSYPANAHIESLNIYTLTAAPPGERKSGVFKALIKPVEEYEQRYNETHRIAIEEYKSKKQFLERQKQAAMNGKNANLERVQELTRELCELEPVHEMRLTCSDTTPEALAAEMLEQGGCMAIMDDEGSVFDIISGLYTNGQGNINLFLKAYDGSPHTIFRRTAENITLDVPYLTFGIMTQPQQLSKVMENPQFTGRGLMQRFLFAFPEGRAGTQSYTSENIPQNVQCSYDELITRLLRMPKQSEPVILTHSKDSYNIFHDYYDLLQSKMRSGGMFENMKDYASKHFGKVLKIAGLLHLCEHTPDETIGGDTAMDAVNIGLWAENMALKAFDSITYEDETTKNAKYILRRIKAISENSFTLRELKRSCQAIHKDDAFTAAIDFLEDMKYIRLETIETGRRPSVRCYVNPNI